MILMMILSQLQLLTSDTHSLHYITDSLSSLSASELGLSAAAPEPLHAVTPVVKVGERPASALSLLWSSCSVD